MMNKENELQRSFNRYLRRNQEYYHGVYHPNWCDLFVLHSFIASRKPTKAPLEKITKIRLHM